jgi:hypothetical protein
VTKLGLKIDFLVSQDNLHLVERWIQTATGTPEYEVTVEDPTIWTRRGRRGKSSAERRRKQSL